MKVSSRIVSLIALVALLFTIGAGMPAPKAAAASAQGNTLGVNLTGTDYWQAWNPSDSLYSAVSYFMDNPATSQDEGANYKHMWFRNPQIYVPYDYFCEESIIVPGHPEWEKKYQLGIDKYTKIINKIKAWQPDSISVCFLTREFIPPEDWKGWSQTPHGATSPLVYPDSNARKAVRLDLDNWKFAMTKFAQTFGSDISYYEILDEPGFDLPSKVSPNSFYGDCKQDYPDLLYWAKVNICAADPVGHDVICGSLLTNPAIAIPGCESSFSYYNALRSALVDKCSSIGVHFFHVPAKDDTRSNPNVYVAAYNYLRNTIFANDGRPIYVTSFGAPWANPSNGYNPVPTPNPNHDPMTTGWLSETSAWYSISNSSGGYGLDGLFHNTLCKKAWYCRDVTLAYNDSNVEYYGMGMTHTQLSTVDPLNTSPSEWTMELQPCTWDRYVDWIKETKPIHISSVSHSSAPAGTEITVDGWGFGNIKANSEYSVMFGSTPASEYTYWSDTQIKCKVPSISGGDVQITVKNPLGTSNAQTFTVNNPVPTTTSISPTSKIAGQPAFTLTVNGTNFVSGSVVKWKGANRTTTYVSATKLTAAIPASDIAATGTADVTVSNPTPGGGPSSSLNFTINAKPKPPPPNVESSTWYLAEGSTNYGFDTYITIENPNKSAVTAKVTYMTVSGPVTAPDVNLPAKSQATVNPRDKLGNQDFSTKVVCKEGKSIAVDRTMSWTGPGAASPEAHSSIGVTSPAKTWYLAEGSSQWGFECWLLIQNPNASEASCDVTYMIEGRGPVTVNKKVPAASRKTFPMADDMGSADASIKVVSNVPIIPERAMYRNNRREGHDSIGTTAPATDYFLAEGATGYNVGYITYVLVQNPNDSPSEVSLTYMTQSGKVAGPSFQMPAKSRKTIRVNDQLGPNTDVSTKVHGSQPIIAERAMYWDNGTGEACHDSIGMATPHKTFYLPDGQSSEGRETWTLVQNPNTVPVTVEVTYMTPTGKGNVTKTESIPGSSRKTFNMLEHSGINGRAAVMVTSKTSGKKIMVERAMYWNNRGAGTDTIGGYGD